MKSRLLLAAVVVAATVCGSTASAIGPFDRMYARRVSAGTPWDQGYYNMVWGEPVALVVPPVAKAETRWAWGVGQTTVRPIWHQYHRTYPGPYAGGRGFQATPRWPSNTDQFGVYSIRGPW